MTHIKWRAHLTPEERAAVKILDTTIEEARQAQRARKKIAARAAMRSIRAGRAKPGLREPDQRQIA